MLHRRKSVFRTVCPRLGLHKLTILQRKPGRMQTCLLGLWDLEEASAFGSLAKVVSLPAPRWCLFEVPLNKGTSCYFEKQAAVSHLTKHCLYQTRSVARLLKPDRKTQTNGKSSMAPGHLCRLPQDSSSLGLNMWRLWIADTPPEARIMLADFPRQHSLMP